MFKKIIAMSSLAVVIAITPALASAQSDNTLAIPQIPTNIDLKNFPNGLPAPISDFVNKLKSVLNSSSNGNISISPSNINLGTPGVLATWSSVNEWFSSNVGISLRDIVKTGANFIIWVWELIIKLIQQGLTYL